MDSVQPMVQVAPGEKPGMAIFLSGGGSNAERILETVSALTDSPVDVKALVTDAPETSRAREIGARFGLTVIEHDIRRFYHDRGETRISIATPEGQRIRSEWTDTLRERLAPLNLHFGVFAGFVPLTNLTAQLPCLNVHPGDLTYLKNGSRYLVGLHTVPIERAILEGLTYLRSSVIQALPYTGKGDDMDNGPILGISGEVPIDLEDEVLENLEACDASRPEKRPKGGYGDRLEELARLNQEKLKIEGDWKVLPAVVLDYARGRFGMDAGGGLHYRLGTKWHPIETVVYSGKETEIVFRDR